VRHFEAPKLLLLAWKAEAGEKKASLREWEAWLAAPSGLWKREAMELWRARVEAVAPIKDSPAARRLKTSQSVAARLQAAEQLRPMYHGSKKVETEAKS
jgi:hypothetical protein